MESFHKIILSVAYTKQELSIFTFIFHPVLMKSCEVLWKNVLWEDKA